VTGWHLLCQDPTEMLRRLPVIIAEDSLVHPRLYTELVWLMAATSKGYRLTWSDAALVMAALATALETTDRVAIYTEPSVFSSATVKQPLSLTLLIRAEFGGMDHDRDFLRRLSVRAETDDLPTDRQEPLWVEYDIDDLVPAEHILLEAIDQHCCPRILHEIPTVQAQAIWWCRSSVANRPFVGRGAEVATEEGVAKRAEHAANLDAHRPALDAFARRQIAQGWTPTTESRPRPPFAVSGPMDAWLVQGGKV
jgi:hypothetical protein